MAYSQVAGQSQLGLIDRIRHLVPSFGEALERRRLFLQTYDELSRLSDRELNDIGLSRWDIGDVARQVAHGS